MSHSQASHPEGWRTWPPGQASWPSFLRFCQPLLLQPGSLLVLLLVATKQVDVGRPRRPPWQWPPSCWVAPLAHGRHVLPWWGAGVEAETHAGRTPGPCPSLLPGPAQRAPLLSARPGVPGGGGPSPGSVEWWPVGSGKLFSGHSACLQLGDSLLQILAPLWIQDAGADSRAQGLHPAWGHLCRHLVLHFQASNQALATVESH